MEIILIQYLDDVGRCGTSALADRTHPHARVAAAAAAEEAASATARSINTLTTQPATGAAASRMDS